MIEEKKIDENYESYETNIKKAIALLDTHKLINILHQEAVKNI